MSDYHWRLFLESSITFDNFKELLKCYLEYATKNSCWALRVYIRTNNINYKDRIILLLEAGAKMNIIIKNFYSNFPHGKNIYLQKFEELNHNEERFLIWLKLL